MPWGPGKFFIDGAVNEANAPFIGEVGKEPMSQDDNPVPKTDEIEDVDKTPSEPGDESVKLDLAEHPDCFCLADGGHRPFI